MKAEVEAGELILESGARLGPGISRNNFLLTAEGAIAKALVRNEPWGSYEFLVEDGLVSVSVLFNGQDLQAVHLAVLSPELAADWSLENEHRRKTVNDR